MAKRGESKQSKLVTRLLELAGERLAWAKRYGSGTYEAEAYGFWFSAWLAADCPAWGTFDDWRDQMYAAMERPAVEAAS